MVASNPSLNNQGLLSYPTWHQNWLPAVRGLPASADLASLAGQGLPPSSWQPEAIASMLQAKTVQILSQALAVDADFGKPAQDQWLYLNPLLPRSEFIEIVSRASLSCSFAPSQCKASLCACRLCAKKKVLPELGAFYCRACQPRFDTRVEGLGFRLSGLEFRV